VLTLKAVQLGGAVAQLGARLDGIEEVVGSNPIGSTNLFRSNPDTCVTERSLSPDSSSRPPGLSAVALYFALLFLSVSSAPSVVKSVPAVRRCAKNA
jgi:hypothetical protein